MTVNVTFLLTLSMTEIDHCKCYDEVMFTEVWIGQTNQLYVYSGLNWAN